MRKRKKITPKIQLEVLKRDNYTCKICGKNPVTDHGVNLEVDHVVPFSCDGSDELSNYQTLCRECNRGKGANETLNRTLKNELEIILNKINPGILIFLQSNSCTRVYANSDDFRELIRKNGNNDFYTIKHLPGIIIGYGNRIGPGIYTQYDDGQQKVYFEICIIK